MDKTIKVDQIWKRKTEDIYITVLENDGVRFLHVKRLDSKHNWRIEDWGLRRKYILIDPDTVCIPCLTKEEHAPDRCRNETHVTPA